ncbi:DUF4974 domain-containing protein [Xanthocytophaga flava]|uniref:DUF4974 domain-containing protein n=1 Tax=Xanthocytophaga flava TaxID=3048013 RepID=UPI0028D41BA1|nr:DUF4974 domain-containing protein [Xanthocytophaga flavus]MDJ1469918.1 DUF4974 domain-containing protein [Xanthocytophaga flavus]
MRQLIIIALLFFCLNIAGAQTTILEKKVNLELKDQTLEQALKLLKQRYGFHFSYSNSQIQLDRKINISVKNQPLRSVLDQLLKDASIKYKVVGDHIVLSSDPTKQTEDLSGKRPVYPPVSRIQISTPPVASVTTVAPVREIKMEPIPVPQTDYKAERRRRNQEALKEVSDKVSDAARKVADKTTQAAKNIDKNLQKLTKDANIPPPSNIPLDGSVRVENAEGAGNDTLNTKDSVASANKKEEITQDSVMTKTDSTETDSEELEHRPFQISFVYPLSTNGAQGYKYVNKVSFNILSGYAGGLEGVEFGGIANLEKSYVKGVQFAGITNIVGGAVTGAQFAGITNIVKEPVEGVQFAGIANVTKGSVTKGGQFAGFINVSKGSVSSMQAAGFINVAQGDIHGAQAAGFANVIKGDARGPQIAGFTNVARNLHGAQIGGFLNVARKVHGVQIGFINIADSVDGVQIGFLNIAKHGYYRVEVWGSETMYANAAFKMGTRQLHSIFAVGYRSEGSKNYIAYGYGMGTEITASNRLALNLDLIAWQINEGSTWTDELNMLNQFRANMSFRVGRRTQIFAGPTFNVYVSRLYDAEKERYGIPLTPWKVYDETHGNTNVVMWPGFNVGIRF